MRPKTIILGVGLSLVCWAVLAAIIVPVAIWHRTAVFVLCGILLTAIFVMLGLQVAKLIQDSRDGIYDGPNDTHLPF